MGKAVASGTQICRKNGNDVFSKRILCHLGAYRKTTHLDYADNGGSHSTDIC